MTSSQAFNVTEQGIQLYGLSKHYGPFRALDDVSLQIRAGEFLTLLGPSGSGKSTLLMALAGFVEPSHGNILIGGKSIIQLPPERRDFGVVFQGYALFPHMTAAQNIAYPLKIRGLKQSEIDARVTETLELVQLGHLATRYPKQLSGGQQQRIALARALVFSPKVLLLDEPMGALDKKLRGDLQLELRQLHKRLGCTFINVTHDQEEAMAMSDRIAIMRAGKIVQLDEPSVLYSRPKTRFVAGFLGKSNFIEGQVVAIDGRMAFLGTPDGRVCHAMDERPLAVGDTAVLAIRPQRLRVGQGPNSRPAVVETAMYLGTHVELMVRCSSGQRLALSQDATDSGTLLREGATVNVNWDPDATVRVLPD